MVRLVHVTGYTLSSSGLGYFRQGETLVRIQQGYKVYGNLYKSATECGSIGRAPGLGPGGWMFKSSHSDRGTVASAVERGCTHKTSAKVARFDS